MRYLSVCSGIEAATVAWHPLGWESAAFSEIEPFPRAVLTHHYPHVPLHGDFTTIKGDEYGAVDLLVGGTPCQSFSVAGLRKGLDDPRGNLMLEYGALAKRLRAKWLVWENVPGVLSSNGGRDFGAFLGMLAELGYGFAYRILDAQYFGLAQRRRRVFVVGCLGDWRSAAAVLFERHSLSGHPAPRRQAGQDAAAGLVGGIDYEGNGHGLDNPTGPLLKGSSSGGGHPLPAVALSVALRGREGGATAELGDEVAGCLRASTGGGDKPHVLAPSFAIQAGALRTNPSSGPDGVGVQADLAYTLEARAEVQAVCFAENSRGELRLEGGDGQRTGALSTGGGKPGQGQPVIAFDWKMGEKARSVALSENLSPTLGTQADRYAIHSGMAVRRLTPRECERLQGFPDDYTLVPMRGRPAADGPRYKALGNFMAVPVMAWIGARINQVRRIQLPEAA